MDYNPGVTNIHRIYIPGNSYRKNGVVSVGSGDLATAYANANEHKIYEYLGQLGTNGFILNRDSTATLYLWVSIDGTTFFGTGADEGVDVEYIPSLPSTQLSVEPMTIHTLKIGADTNDVHYTMVII